MENTFDKWVNLPQKKWEDKYGNSFVDTFTKKFVNKHTKGEVICTVVKMQSSVKELYLYITYFSKPHLLGSADIIANCDKEFLEKFYSIFPIE